MFTINSLCTREVNSMNKVFSRVVERDVAWSLDGRSYSVLWEVWSGSTSINDWWWKRTTLHIRPRPEITYTNYYQQWKYHCEFEVLKYISLLSIVKVTLGKKGFEDIYLHINNTRTNLDSSQQCNLSPSSKFLSILHLSVKVAALSFTYLL